jgi:hypothetical protein
MMSRGSRTAGGGQCLVGRDVGRMQHVAEKLVLQRREEAIGTVHHPFEQGAGIAVTHDRGEDGGEPPYPLDRKSILLEGRGVGIHGLLHRVFAIVE